MFTSSAPLSLGLVETDDVVGPGLPTVVEGPDIVLFCEANDVFVDTGAVVGEEAVVPATYPENCCCCCCCWGLRKFSVELEP